MGWLFAIAGVVLGSAALRKHNSRRLREENTARERLGLPPLTREQFQVTVVEKSADYRGNVNQHM